MLDGLDEVADSSMRKRVTAWVGRQLITYGNNRFVLTSRPYGYRDNPLDGVTVLDVQAFTPEQIEHFVRNWYLANELKSWGKDEPGVHLRAREGAHDLLQRLRPTPALLALAVNPLLLTMIATVHCARGSLPGKRVDLYAEMCEVLLGKRQEARGIAQDLSPIQKQQVLRPLAYFLMQQGKREIEREVAQQIIAPALALVSTQIQPADFLPLSENTSGLLLDRGCGVYGFVHQTFQEYLAAMHIKEEGLELALVAQVANSWWHETIRLYCAQTDATALIQACLAGNPPTVAALTLAFECDEEKLKIQPQAQAQLNALLTAGGEDSNPERQRVMTEALLARRLRRMVYLRQETYIDRSFITCAEYQVFLNEQRTQGKYYQPNHWTSGFFPAGLGKTPVLGVFRSDAQAFCDWLTARDMEGWHYRLPRVEEWPLEERKSNNELNAEIGYWTEDEPFFVWSQGKPPDGLHQQFSSCIAHGIDRALASERDLTLVRSLDYARALANASALALDYASDYTRAHALKHAHTLILDHASASVSTLEQARALVLDLAIILVLARASAPNLDHASILARANASGNPRLNSSDLTRALASSLDLASAINRDLSSYTMLFLLQERNAGNLPVYESILLVKQRQYEKR